MKKRRNHDAGFKARVALEAVMGERTVSELAAEYGVHPTMIHQWKKALLDGAAEIFVRGGKRAPEIDEDTVRSLHAKIGELAVANVFCHESSSLGSASEARDDCEEPSQPVGRGAMPPAVDLAVVVLLRTDGRDGHEPRPHGEDRQAVPRDAVLWGPADDMALAERWACRELQAHSSTDAAYALDADLPEA